MNNEKIEVRDLENEMNDDLERLKGLCYEHEEATVKLDRLRDTRLQLETDGQVSKGEVTKWLEEYGELGDVDITPEMCTEWHSPVSCDVTLEGFRQMVSTALSYVLNAIKMIMSVVITIVGKVLVYIATMIDRGEDLKKRTKRWGAKPGDVAKNVSFGKDFYETISNLEKDEGERILLRYPEITHARERYEKALLKFETTYDKEHHVAELKRYRESAKADDPSTHSIPGRDKLIEYLIYGAVQNQVVLSEISGLGDIGLSAVKSGKVDDGIKFYKEFSTRLTSANPYFANERMFQKGIIKENDISFREVLFPITGRLEFSPNHINCSNFWVGGIIDPLTKVSPNSDTAGTVYHNLVMGNTVSAKPHFVKYLSDVTVENTLYPQPMSLANTGKICAKLQKGMKDTSKKLSSMSKKAVKLNNSRIKLDADVIWPELMAEKLKRQTGAAVPLGTLLASMENSAQASSMSGERQLRTISDMMEDLVTGQWTKSVVSGANRSYVVLGEELKDYVMTTAMIQQAYKVDELLLELYLTTGEVYRHETGMRTG